MTSSFKDVKVIIKNSKSYVTRTKYSKGLQSERPKGQNKSQFLF